MPDEIKLQPLRSLIEACWPGEWGTDPVGDQGNCVVYRATDIDDDGHLRLEGGAERSVLASKLAAKSLRPNDILLEASGGAPDRPVGRVALVSKPSRKAALTSNFFRLIRPKNTVDARFLTLQLVALNRSSAIWRYQQQTTGLINLKVGDYLGHAVWMPALDTQRKIADLFDCIDTSIERTDALIAKHQQIKAGLMHDLFTRGVLPNGQLRPPRSDAPGLYQETALGWIPAEWKPVSLRELVGASSIVNGPFGSDLLTSELQSEGVPVLYVQDIKPGAFTRVSTAHITTRKASELAFCSVRQGDVLVAKVGDPPCDSCVYENAEPAVVTQDVIRLRPSAEVSPAYLAAVLNSALGRKVVKKISIEGTRERVSLTDFKGLVFPIAPPDEQKRIAERVVEMQVAITSERTKVSKLQRQKLGLMQDLLTGRVSVEHLTPESASA